MNAKTETLAGDEAWQLVADADRIFIASGKKTLEYQPSVDEKKDIMQKMLGRTGNLRAPTLRQGNTFYIGYNDDLYAKITKSQAGS